MSAPPNTPEPAVPTTLNREPMAATPLRVLELHADYACANTGICCREPWGIRFQGPDLIRLRGAMSESGMPAAEIDRHFVVSGEGGQLAAAFALGEDEHCIFVGRDGEGRSRCTAHERWGHQRLPTVCQTFPRVAVRTPAGIYLTLSYTCPTAAGLLLRENGLIETAPRAVYRHRPDLGGSVYDDGAPAPQFAAGASPPWEAHDYFWRWAAEWMATPRLNPAQALYGLGRVIGELEKLGGTVAELALVVDVLDEVRAELPGHIRRSHASHAPSTELGIIYFETLLNIVRQVRELPEELQRLVEGTPGKGSDARRELAAAYDLEVRPRLAEFQLIERNFMGSRCYANQLAYRANYVRTGYCALLFSMIALRFAALAEARHGGRRLDELAWQRAAGMVDKLTLHNDAIQLRLIETLEGMPPGNIESLAAAALF